MKSTINIEEEVWKEIPGYEGYYEVSSHGKVRSCTRTLWNGKGYHKVLGAKKALRKKKNGYFDLDLTKNGIITKFLIHRLVAMVFLPNPYNRPVVNHLDGDPSNNCLSNLEWATYSENTIHAWKTGLSKPNENQKASARITAKLAQAARMKVVVCSETGTEYKCVRDAAETIKMPMSTLTAMLNGRNPNKTKFSYK